MKVKDILPQKEKLEMEAQNLQKLDSFLKSNKELSDSISENANLSMSISKLITECRMYHFERIAEIDRKIENAEIQDND